MTLLTRLDEKERLAVERATTEFPVRLGSLAEALGVKVFKATLPAGVSGEISRDKQGNYIIRINRHEAPRRQRFTLAHEIGHLLLHKDFIGDGIVDDALYRSRLSNNLEFEANRMAADLLMPRSEVEKLSKLEDEDDQAFIDRVSDYFAVSPQAAQIRLGL